MADVYSAIYEDSDYWDGTIAWGYDATSDKHSPTPHANQVARDAQYVAGYTSLAAWEAARDGVSQAGDDEWAIIQGPWSSAETTGVAIGGFSSDTCRVKAIGVARTNGEYGDNADVYQIETTDASCFALIENCSFEGFELQITYSAEDTYQKCINGNTYNAEVTACYLKCVPGATVKYIGIDSTGTVTVKNCIVENFPRYGIYCTSTLKVYNCTVTGTTTVDAIRDNLGTSTVKNCAVFNNVDDFQDIDTADYNATDDDADRGTNGQDLNENASGEWTAAFTSYATGDFTIKDTNSLLYQNGQSQTNDAEVPSDDIAGNARTDGQESIGAFEYAAAGGLSIPNPLNRPLAGPLGGPL